MLTSDLAVDVAASLGVLERDEHVHGGMLKFPTDLDRYRRIIDETRPDVLIETGTFRGGSARWFADLGVHVVTVDHLAVDFADGRIEQIVGDSVDRKVLAAVARRAKGKRVMVSLDSDHSAAHVAAEVKAYGRLVSPGCYLVVEDTIFHYATDAERGRHGVGVGDAGTPMDAVAALAASPNWERAVDIESMSPLTACPAGWWRRV